VGTEYAQLDIGYRDHWFSPMSSSSMLISTEAPTMPSVTVSNYEPISPLGFTYEVFAAKMARQDGIKYFNSTTSGHPRLAGVQLGVEPVAGYALTVNRLMQYGGGARGNSGVSDLLRAFYKNNTGSSNVSDDAATGHLEFGNSLAAVTGTMQFPGRVPFSISMEYAGEDGSFGGNYRLGDSAFSLCMDFPLLWQRFDFKYEATEWQNVWYTHHIYPEGLTNNGAVLGHWFGDQRQFNDRVGGHSHVLQLGAHMDDGSYWRATYRNLAFVRSIGYQSLPAVPYRHLSELGLRYDTNFRGRGAGIEMVAGSDARGDKYGRLAASVDWLPTNRSSYSMYGGEKQSDTDEGYKLFVDLGINSTRVSSFVDPNMISGFARQPEDGHMGFGARRAVGEHSDLGMRLELDRINHRKLLSLRALDYRYRFTPSVAASIFAGAGRYDDGAPAYGWYFGYGVGWLGVASTKWDLNVDWRYYDKLSRNRVLSDDPAGTAGLPRIHYDIDGMAMYLSRSF
jgi:Capsule assembly protein Wzi